MENYRARRAILAAAVLALAACSSPAPAPTAADPVAILRETGAIPDSGTVYGGHDVFGDRMASGSFPGGESVTVYTCSSQAAFLAEEARPQVDDQHGVVTIPSKLAVIAVDAAEDGWGGGPTPQQIASAVGGLTVDG